MNGSTLLHRQIFGFLSQYSKYKDRRHLQALAWMVTGLIGSGELSMAAWEPYVVSRATQAQSYERRWRRLVKNPHINVQRMYLPLVMMALSGWGRGRLYLALDTTVLWDKYCMNLSH
jgi:hypothetical protein